ncbi:MAG TPA: ABC transporter substrate-binding protein [Acidimicrobiia bacterium]|nr:ABC transporter substrate-binding protein [Acidimicrobiia bacterium]
MLRSRLVKRLTAVGAGAALAVVGLAVPVAGAAPAQASGKCPVNALKNAKSKPVEITYWQGGLQRANEEAILRLADKFNASQNDVRVSVVNQTTYADTLNKFRAGLSSGDLPDLVQIEDTGLQQMIDTRAVLPAQACVDADKYDLSDNLKRVVDYYSVKGKLYPMPFNVSNPVFYYNKKAFEAAGLDPNNPPKTLDEVKTAAQKLKDSGTVSQAGMGLKLDPWYLEQWSALGGKTYVNNGNGRKSRATATTFDNATGKEIFTFLNDMVKAGLARTNPADGPQAFDNLIGIGNGNFGMTIDTSAALGTIQQLLSSGQYPNVELGVAPMPGPNGKGGVLVGGGANYIVNKSSPEKQAAAWQFAKFLNDPENQADWSVATGYIPIRQSAADRPQVQQYWAANPAFKVAYDQLVGGVTNTATAGPVIGDYQGVRDAVLDAEQQMFNGTSPNAALKQAKQDANAKIQEYNSRVSG